jgi:hypothetical protein
MYVATFCLPDLNWLIRVDVHEQEGNVMATYRRTARNGDEESYSCPLGPDQYDIGYPTIAIITMIRDLNWAEISGHMHVIHHGALDQDDLIDILQQVHPAYAIRNLMTTGVIQ